MNRPTSIHPPSATRNGDSPFVGVRFVSTAIVMSLGASAIFAILHGPVRGLLLAAGEGAASEILRAVSVAHLSLGLWVFLRAGSRLITPIGVYFLGSAVFLGYGGLAPADSQATPNYLGYASLTILVFNLIVLIVAVRGLDASGIRWRSSPTDDNASRVATVGRRPIALTPYLIVWATLTVASDLLRAVPILGGFADLIHAGISLLLLQAFLAQKKRRSALRLLVGLPVFLMLSVGSFVVNYYTGFARIIFGGFVIAAATLVNRRYPSMPIKALVIVGLIPGIIFAGSGDRTGLGFREAALGFGEARGVTSATGAIPVFALALAQHDTVGLDSYALRGGRTFMISATHWVPREWWPTKPNSPGIELAQLLFPEAAFGYSVVGSNAIEWLLNFDLIGLIPGALLTGVGLAALERWTREMPRRRRPLPHDVALRALVTGNLVIFAWAGSFSFSARTFTPFMIILGLRAIALLGTRRTDTRSPRLGG